MRRHSIKKHPKVNIKLEHMIQIESYFSDFKCPDCKAYVLYSDKARKVPMVRCKKCGFSDPLEAFAVSHMNYKIKEGKATIEIPDIYGGPAKAIELT